MTPAPSDTGSHEAPAVEPTNQLSQAQPATPRRRRLSGFHVALLAIAALGLVLRVGYVLDTRGDTSLCGIDLCGDALYYSAQANVNGLGYFFDDPRDLTMPAADHPPMTAVVLAPVTTLFGESTRLVTQQRLVMALFGAAVIIAIGLLGRAASASLRRDDPRRASAIGLIAACIAAVNANFWMNDVVVMSETFATLGIALTLLACYRFIRMPTWPAAFVVGVLVGLSALARAELLLLAVVTFVPLAMWARSLSWPARLGRVAVAAAAAVVVLAPWTVFNLSRFDEPVLMSTNDGLTIVGANCDVVYGIPSDGGLGFWNLDCAMRLNDRIPPGADQSVVSRTYRSIGTTYIREHLDRVPQVVAVRTLRVWGVYDPPGMVWLNLGEGRARWASWTGFVQWWLLVVPAIAGAVVVRRRRDHLWPLASTVVIVTITAIVFYGIVRFRIAADVAVTVLAAVAIEALVHRLRRTSRPAKPGQ